MLCSVLGDCLLFIVAMVVHHCAAIDRMTTHSTALSFQGKSKQANNVECDHLSAKSLLPP